MKNTLASLTGLALLLATATAANAGTYNPALDYVITINSGNTFNVTNVNSHFTAIVPDTGGTVVGFSFEGSFFVNPLAFPGTAGQTRLTITAPDTSTYIIGGTPPAASSWDFQSATGSNNVTYDHGPDLLLPDSASTGTWSFDFLRIGGAPATLQWSNVTITLHSVPAPGALAFFGLAFVGRSRRRRRA